VIPEASTPSIEVPNRMLLKSWLQIASIGAAGIHLESHLVFLRALQNALAVSVNCGSAHAHTKNGPVPWSDTPVRSCNAQVFEPTTLRPPLPLNVSVLFVFSTLSQVLPRAVTTSAPLEKAPFAHDDMTSPLRYGFWLLPYSIVCFPFAGSDTVTLVPDWLGSEPILVTSSILSGRPL
jgi:hypothetical protein